MKGAYETIATFENAIQAHVAKAKLESEGVDSYIRDEHTIGVNPLYTAALGGVKLQVEAQDADLARRILARDESEMEQEEGEVKASVCPRCASNVIELRDETMGRVMTVLSWLLSGAIFRGRNHWTCKRCRHSWRRW